MAFLKENVKYNTILTLGLSTARDGALFIPLAIKTVAPYSAKGTVTRKKSQVLELETCKIRSLLVLPQLKQKSYGYLPY